MTATETKTTYVEKAWDDFAARKENLAAVQDWLMGHADALTELDVSIYTSMSVACIYADTPEQYATLARMLADGAPIGAVQKDADEFSASVDRHFGHALVSVRINRDQVCERVVTGTETVVKTALSCQVDGCGEPIYFDDSPVWPGSSDNTKQIGWVHHGEARGHVATPPDFGAVEVETVEIVEWSCSPLLSEAG